MYTALTQTRQWISSLVKWLTWGAMVLFGTAAWLGVTYGVIVQLLWGRPTADEKAVQSTWFACEERIVTAWAVYEARDLLLVRERLEFVDKYPWGIGVKSNDEDLQVDSFLALLMREAESLGASQNEILALDKKVRQECGPFPRYEAQWGGRVHVE